MQTAKTHPTPRRKLPDISPILKADTATLHVSREKDKEIALVDGGWDDAKVVQPDGCGQAWKGGSYPPAGEAVTPLVKNRDPPRGGPLFYQR